MCMYVFVFALLVVLYKNEREERKGGASSERGLCHTHAMRKNHARASSPPTAKKISLNLLSQVNELVERI